MREISIVIPVYNEEKAIVTCLQTVNNIDYPRDKFEVIVVDDASTDSTAKVVSEFDFVKLIRNNKNLGRYKTRVTGVLAAKFNNILFIDSRTIVYENILSEINKSPEETPIQGIALGLDSIGRESELTWFEIFFMIIRREIFGDTRTVTTTYITPENFDTIPKGTGVFFSSKEILINIFNDIGDTEILSDDTLLLKKIAARKNIFFNPNVRIVNYGRKNVISSLKHLFQRGPKFVDYYFKFKKRFFVWILLLVLFIISNIFIIIFNYKLLFYEVISLFIFNITLAFYLTRTVKEYLVYLIMSPFITTVFSIGIVAGLINTWRKKL